MAQILIAAVGNRDPYDERKNQGPILTTISYLKSDSALLVYNKPPAVRNMEANALQTKKVLEESHNISMDLYPVDLPDPSDYDAVLDAYRGIVEKIREKYHRDALKVAISPGTPAIQAA